MRSFDIILSRKVLARNFSSSVARKKKKGKKSRAAETSFPLAEQAGEEREKH